MKIVIFEVEDWERASFDALSREQEVTFVPGPLTGADAERYSDAEVVCPFIYSRLDRDTLGKLRELRLIATRSTGTDHIDTRFCAERGIRVSNVPSYGSDTVAEHVFALLLTISHRTWDAIDRTRKGDFSLRGLRGFDLKGKTLGVVGTGEIGRCVVRIAKGFGMGVVAHDRAPDPTLVKEYAFEYVGLDELLSRSDIVSLHVPLTPETEGMISEREFDLMKPGAILINTARGSIVDVRALLKALAEGRVGAAGLDVLPEEPSIREEAELLRSVFQRRHNLETLLADHVLLRMRNVYITPHSAFDTREAVQRILDTTAENIGAFVRGEPRNVVV